ncbi:fumarate reductase flavoprotein subunit precursor [mine drainage metagenome]|uniref:Fumarate reductase flavoprotein subunit n=1 Tax=mine drainage metagenome TaxID=410659 RepID=A0A1J5QGS3_9ZZZZ
MRTATFACDVLVAGGGVAALCAAISAREAGASVILAEKAPVEMRGGNTRHSRNFRVAHDEASHLSPGTYSADEYFVEIMQVAGEAGNEALAQTLAHESKTVVTWLAERDVVFENCERGRIPGSRKTVFVLGGGKAMVNALYAAAMRCGITVLYDCGITAVREDGSAAMLRHGSQQTVAYKAMVVCTGGYQANTQWLESECGSGMADFVNRGTPFAEGELLQSLLNMGAKAVGVPGACHLVAVDARSPRHDGGIITRVKNIPLGMVVDCFGRRFHAEDAEEGPSRYSMWGHLIAKRPRQRATLILDEAARCRSEPSAFLPLRAENLEEMADLLQVELGNLRQSVQEHGRLAGPPYWAIPLCPGITFTGRGVAVDPQARVIMNDDTPCDNLFAAGMIMAPNIITSDYLAGTAITIGAVFGRIAGQGAAWHAIAQADADRR